MALRRAATLPCTRDALAALTVAARRQGIAANSANETDNSVTVRSQGYGPSSDLVKGVSASSSLYVEAALHPQDAEIQRRVLALSYPDVEHITVATSRPDTSYGFLAFTPEQKRAAPETLAPPLTAAALTTRLTSMETAWQEQLASVANVVVEQIATRTASQLHGLELAQRETGRTLAQLIIDALRDEITTRASSEVTKEGQTEARHVPTEAEVETMAQRVARRVAAAMQERDREAVLSVVQATVEQSETRMMQYLALLEERVKATVQDVASSATPTTTADAAGTSADQLTHATSELRRDVVNAIEHATQAQREHLSAMLENALRAHEVENGPTAANFDVNALQDSLEGALRAATDNIRLGVTAELKKWAKARSKNIGNNDGDGDAVVVDGALQAMLDRLSENVAQSFSTTEATLQQLHGTDDAVQSILVEQRRMTALVAHMQEQLTAVQLGQGGAPSQDVAHTADAASEAMTRVGSELSASMAAMQDRLRRLCETVAQQAEYGDRQRKQELLAMARAMSESVSTAVSARTTAALEGALTQTQAQLDKLVQSVTTASVTAASVAEAVQQRRQPAGAEWEASARTVVQQSVTTALQEALAPQLKQLLDRVDFWQHEAHAVQERHMLTLASTLSEAVRAALTAHAPDHAALAALRADLTTTLQTEMGKTHEVDLTPMYKYIDSMLVFVKDEMAKMEGSMSDKLVSLGDSVTSAVQYAHSAQATELDKLIRSTILQEMRAMAAEVKAATVASQQVSSQLQADLTAQLRAIPAAVEHHATIVVDSLQHALQSSETRAAVQRVEQGIATLSSRVDVQQLGSSLEGSVRDAVGALTTRLDRSVANAIQDVKAELHAAVAEVAGQQHAQQQQPPQSQVAAQWQVQRGEIDTDAVKRNAQLLDAIRGSAAVESQATQARLAALQNSLTELGTTQQTALNAQLERIMQSITDLHSSAAQRSAKASDATPSRELDAVQAALNRVDATLAEQTEALRALHEVASAASGRAIALTAKTEEEVATTTPNSTELATATTTVATLIVQMQQIVGKIAGLMARVEGAREAQVGPLLQQVRTYVSDLHDMQQRLLASQAGGVQSTMDATTTAAQTRAAPVPTSDSTLPSAEAASLTASKDAMVITTTVLETLRGEAETRLRAATDAVVQAVQAETASLGQRLTEQMATLKSGREGDLGNLLDAIDKLSHTLRADVAVLTARPPPLTAGEAQAMAEAQNMRLTDALHKADERTRDALHDISVAVVAAQSASTATQQLVQDEMQRMAHTHEAHTTRAVRAGLEGQLEALENFVARTVTTSVQDSAATVARHVEEVLARQRASAEVEDKARRDTEAAAREVEARAHREREQRSQDRAAVRSIPSTQGIGPAPLCWWLLNPLLVCGTMLLCAYFLFVCFLVAFVPLPEPVRDGDTAAVLTGTSSSTSPLPITTGAVTAVDEDAAVVRRRRGRRVVDSVM